MSPNALNYSVTLKIPFQNSKQAVVALNSLSPDPELKPDQLSKELFIENDNQLIAKFSAVSDRVLRVAVNSFFDCINLVIECIDELDVNVVE